MVAGEMRPGLNGEDRKAQLELKAMQLKAVEPVKDDGEMKPTRRAGDKERDDIVAGRAFVPMGNQRHHNLNLP